MSDLPRILFIGEDNPHGDSPAMALHDGKITVPDDVAMVLCEIEPKMVEGDSLWRLLDGVGTLSDVNAAIARVEKKVASYEGGDRPPSPPARFLTALAYLGGIRGRVEVGHE